MALLLAVVASGCGELSRDELVRGVESLESIAAEGQLIARDVAQDRSKATFVRVRARELAEDADHEAEKLADATPAVGLAGGRDRAVTQAQALADAIGELQVFPGDERIGSHVARTLARHGQQLTRLVERL